MKDIIFVVVVILVLGGVLFLSSSYGLIESKRQEFCNFTCYKNACENHQLNGVIKSACVESEFFGKCNKCECSLKLTELVGK